MKIRIVQSGWAGYTGPLGAVEFVDGVSVDEVSRADASVLAGIVAIETVEEEGKEARNPSVAQHILDNRCKSTEELSGKPAIDLKKAVAEPGRQYSVEELQAIGDREGILGLRKVGDPINVKATSISALIAKILQKQSDDLARWKEHQHQAVNEAKVAEAARIAEERAKALAAAREQADQPRTFEEDDPRGPAPQE